MTKFSTLLICLISTTVSLPSAFAAGSNKEKKAQVLKFDGMSIKNSKGSPRDGFASSKEKTDFEYFFKTKVSFKEKIVESLEVVR
jgi:hypothetical protein